MDDRPGGSAIPDETGQGMFDSLKAGNPAKITLVYESDDGKLCLFEDGDGHLTAVRAENLA